MQNQQISGNALCITGDFLRYGRKRANPNRFSPIRAQLWEAFLLLFSSRCSTISFVIKCNIYDAAVFLHLYERCFYEQSSISDIFGK